MKLFFVLPPFLLVSWLASFSLGNPQTVADAHSEVLDGWKRLEQKDRCFVADVTECRKKRGSDNTQIAQYQILRNGECILRRSQQENEISVVGLDYVFRLRRSSDSNSEWYLNGVPLEISRDLAVKLFDSFMGREVLDVESPEAKAADLVIAQCLVGPSSPFRFFRPEGAVKSSKLEVTSEDGNELVRLSFEWAGVPSDTAGVVGASGFVLLDPKNDFRVVRGETLTSTGKTKRTMATKYLNDEGSNFVHSYECLVLDGNNGFVSQSMIQYEVNKRFEQPDLSNFRIQTYGINLRKAGPNRFWLWLVMGGAVCLILGFIHHVRRKANE